jgi:hypothetical protein
MTGSDIPSITPERWLANLLNVASRIADKGHQERRWLAPDAFAWENPGELINVLSDCVFDDFITQYERTFTGEQRAAALGFRDAVNCFGEATPQRLDPVEVLADVRWAAVRQQAAAFVAAFKDNWPESSARADSI